MIRTRHAVAAFAATLLLAGCDWFGPSGPGTLSMTVTGSDSSPSTAEGTPRSKSMT